VAERRGLQRFRTEQSPYSLLARGIETSVLPVCRRYGRRAHLEPAGLGLSHRQVPQGPARRPVHRPRRPDCTIVAEPVTFFLLALGRCTTARAVARGKILTWGRKPWLAAGFPALFRPVDTHGRPQKQKPRP
jgi:hypothetical protein